MKISKSFTIFLFLLIFFSFFTVFIGSVNSQDQRTVSLPDPMGGKTPQVVIGDTINMSFSLVGSLALLMFIYGGLIWMTSSGKSEKVKKGKDILVWATIGMTLIFSSYVIVRLIIETLD